MKITKLGCVLSVLALFAAPFVSFAIDVFPLPLETQASRGASHMVEFDFEDLTETATNGTAQTTAIMAVPAKMGVEFVGAFLVTAFDTVNTNYTGSTTVTVGDGTDPDLFLESMELASDGTEVWLKMGRESGSTIAPTVVLQTQSLTDTNAVTALAVTNVTVTSVSTLVAFGSKVYTSADTVDVVFTQNANEGLADNTVGKIRFYFRLWDAR